MQLNRCWYRKRRGRFPDGCAGSPIPKIGYFGWNTFELAFDNCRVPNYKKMRGKESRGNAFKSVAAGLEARAHTARVQLVLLKVPSMSR